MVDTFNGCFSYGVALVISPLGGITQLCERLTEAPFRNCPRDMTQKDLHKVSVF